MPSVSCPPELPPPAAPARGRPVRAAKAPPRPRAVPLAVATVKARFRPVSGAQPAGEILEQVRAKLRSQELRAGDRLPTERELSAQFGVSRNSVRQALRSLQEQGLLEIRKGPTGGAVICGNGALSVETVLSDLFSLGTIRPQDLTEVRVLVGTEVVRLACARASDAEFDGLEANIAAAEDAVRQDDLARRTALNLEFHKLLARMSGNALLVAVTDAVTGITGQFVSGIERTPNRYVMPFRRRLLRYLRARDVDAATHEMRRHLQQQEVLYLKAHARVQAARQAKENT